MGPRSIGFSFGGHPEWQNQPAGVPAPLAGDSPDVEVGLSLAISSLNCGGLFDRFGANETKRVTKPEVRHALDEDGWEIAS